MQLEKPDAKIVEAEDGLGCVAKPTEVKKAPGQSFTIRNDTKKSVNVKFQSNSIEPPREKDVASGRTESFTISQEAKKKEEIPYNLDCAGGPKSNPKIIIDY